MNNYTFKVFPSPPPRPPKPAKGEVTIQEPVSETDNTDASSCPKAPGDDKCLAPAPPPVSAPIGVPYTSPETPLMPQAPFTSPISPIGEPGFMSPFISPPMGEPGFMSPFTSPLPPMGEPGFMPPFASPFLSPFTPMPPLEAPMEQPGPTFDPMMPFGPPCDSPMPPFPGPIMPVMPGMPSQGQMPANTVIAHAYVPWQVLDKTFGPEEALSRGTLFPELYQPQGEYGPCEGPEPCRLPGGVPCDT